MMFPFSKPILFKYSKRILHLLFFFISVKSSLFAQGADCATATNLPNVQNFCSTTLYTNAGSTASSYANASCVSATATEDVWFQFTAIGSDVLISASGSGAGGTMVRPRIAIYSGSCATTINELACNNGTTTSNVTQLYKGGLSPGTVYFIRISTTNSNEGTFKLCVNSYTPTANAGADCGGAAFLCDKNPVSVATLSGPGLNSDEPESSSCMEDSFGPDESNSSWYYWTCETSGTLTLDIVPITSTDDIDFIVYQLTGANTCGGRTILRCNTTSCLGANGSTGLSLTDTDITEDPSCDPWENAYCQFINMTAGTSYAILVNNWSGTTGFTMSFGGTGTFTGPKPIITSSTTNICQGETINFDGSTSTNVAGGLAWNFNNGGSPTSATGAGPHTITYNTSGNYVAILTGTSLGGCTSIKTANIIVNAIPTAPVTNNVSYCQGATANALTATGTNLQWYSAATGGTASTTAPTPSTAISGVTTYYVAQKINNCESPRVPITVTVNAIPTITVNSPTICPGLSANLTASGANTYSWLPVTALNTSIGANVISTPSTTMVYTVTGTSPEGCSANATATVTVGNNLTITANSTSICNGNSGTLTVSGASTYTWTPASNLNTTSGATVIANPTTTTIYTITGDDGSGCTGTTQATVTVNPIPNIDAGVDDTVCLGSFVTLNAINAITYLWTADASLSSTNIANPVATPTATTTYTVTGTSNGCSASDIVTIAVPPVFTISATSTDVTCGSLCDGTATVTANPGFGGFAVYTYSWSNGATSALVSNLCAGSYTVIVNDLAMCSQTTSVTITEPLPLTVSEISNSPVSCNGGNNGTASIIASGGTPNYTYNWMPGNSSGTSNNTLTAGTYTITATDSKNCTSSTQIIITEPLQLSVSVSANTTICIGQSVDLLAQATGGSAPYSFLWSDGTGASYPSTDVITVNPTITTVYTVRANDANACPTSNTQTVTIFLNPPLSFSPITSYTVCEGTVKSISFGASGGGGNYDYSWSPSSGVNLITNNGSVAEVSPTSTTVYTVTVTDNCSVNAISNTFTASINPKPILNINPVTSGCQPLEVDFSATSNPPCFICNWDFDGNGTSTSCDPPPRVFANAETYHVIYRATDNIGCSNSDTATFTVYPVPNAMFLSNPQPTTIIDPEITFTDITDAVVLSHNWTFYDGPLTINATGSIASYLYSAIGDYPIKLVVISDKGCIDSISQTISISDDFTIYIPNAFSPNNDKFNSHFTAYGNGITDFSMEIYDRGGSKIFKTNNIEEGWDGKISGNLVENGIYIYRIEIMTFLDEKKVYTGCITLVR